MKEQESELGSMPEIAPSELSAQELRELIDGGDIFGVERALREHTVRLPVIIRELDRILEQGQGNLAAVLATMLINRFHVAQANVLAEKVLGHSAKAGVDELVDLAAALFQQERLEAARKVVAVALKKSSKHSRALYFSALLQARRGDVQEAFTSISKCEPKMLGAHGLAAQARYAAWCGKDNAVQGALRLAKQASESGDHDAQLQVQAAAAVARRFKALALSGPPSDLRTAFLIEYGSLLIEQSTDEKTHGQFDAQIISYADVGRLIQRIPQIIRELDCVARSFIYADEHGEVVAAGLGRLCNKPHRAWRKDFEVKDGDWLCMGSAGNHPHLDHAAVRSLDHALKQGTLRSLCLVLTRGWRCPVVPDLIGRISQDDELPWAIDDEIEDIYETILGEQTSTDLLRDDGDEIKRMMSQFGYLLRLSKESERPGHLPYRDEIPLSGGR